LTIGLSYIAFTMLRYIPSIPSFLRAFIMKWCWILLKAFSASIEMIKWFLSLLLLMCCITFIHLHMLNHPCIPGMKPTWLWWMIFHIFFGFSLSLFCWQFLLTDHWAMCCSASNCLHDFYWFFLLLNSSFNALWSDRVHGIIYIFLYFLRPPLCPKIWSIWGKVPWAAEKNVHCVEVGWNFLYTSTRSIWSMVWFSSRISLLKFLFGWPIYWW
jgi:hypothetical protein